jgi:small GTP-binding protein
MLNRRTSGVFNTDYRPTIAAAFATVSENIDGEIVSLNVWDTAGQEKYQNMMPLYFRQVACVILVLDITSPASVDFVKHWVDTELPGIQPKPLLFLCTNKTDLDPAINVAEFEKWAEELQFPLYRTSANTGANIGELFHAIAAALAERKVNRREVDGQQIEGEGNGSKCC